MLQSHFLSRIKRQCKISFVNFYRYLFYSILIIEIFLPSLFVPFQFYHFIKFKEIEVFITLRTILCVCLVLNGLRVKVSKFENRTIDAINYNDYKKEKAFKGMLIIRFMNDDITFPVNVDKRRKNKRIFQSELFIVSYIQKIASFAWLECKILRKNQAGVCRGCARNVRLQIGLQLRIHWVCFTKYRY